MKPEVVAGAFGLFIALPLASFFLARAGAVSVPARAMVLLAALALFAAGTWGIVTGNARGFFQGFEMTLFGLTAYAVAHLAVAGVADRWIANRAGWAERPLVLRRAVTAGLIATGLATVLLWPQIH